MLAEDAELDISISRDIDRLRMELVNYIYRRRKEGKEDLPDVINYRGGKIPAVQCNRFGKTSLFHDLIIGFDPNLDHNGSAIPLRKPVGEIRYAVLLRATDLNHFYSLIWSRNHTFRHELVHVCDFKRRKGGNETIRGTSHLVKGDDFTDYANNSLESNAFFHELAEPLLDGLRFMHEQPDVACELLTPIAGPFSYWLEMRVLRLGSTSRMMYKVLSPQLKRRMMGRIKALWDAYWAEWTKLDKFDPNNA